MALVTGASVGIGAAIARELVRGGMKVMGCARDVEKIKVCYGLKLNFTLSHVQLGLVNS